MSYREDEFGELRPLREPRPLQPQASRGSARSLGVRLLWAVVGLVWVAQCFLGVRF